MRKVGINYLTPGMKIARSIYRSNGQILLAAGMILTDKFISRLGSIGIPAVYIVDDVFAEISLMGEVVSENVRRQSVEEARGIFNSYETKSRLNLKAVRHTVDQLMDQLFTNGSVLYHCFDIQHYDDYTYSHSVNVCILSMMTGITLGYHELKLRELGTGALLHDIGKTNIDREVLNKTTQLDSDEYEHIKKHSEFGFNTLRTQDDIPLLAAHVALQHHERWNGTGYPRGLSTTEIHDYARIVAVVDVFDALATDRPYRKGYTVDEALEYCTTMSGFYFDPDATDAMISNVARYPVGSIVKVNSGEIGQVINIDHRLPARPTLLIIFDKNVNVLPNRYKVDLRTHPLINITHVMRDDQTSELVAKILSENPSTEL